MDRLHGAPEALAYLRRLDFPPATASFDAAFKQDDTPNIFQLQSILYGLLIVGFLLFEITLIQKLILFLGYPTYSLTVTLASVLLFTGVGALISGRRAAK